jgi:hypothetical protein
MGIMVGFCILAFKTLHLSTISHYYYHQPVARW